jgi:hypothetical protein
MLRPEVPEAGEQEAPRRHRVSRSPEALYSTPRMLRKRRRCDGHLSDRHMIEAGQSAVWSSLPPHSDIGNERWWHAVFCIDCAPAECVTPPSTDGAS